ncbi:hypothetical protein Cgig2_033994 [Carnegiea gigantea]|uniref:Uncharacterized protein n=1 Tax=Carnegiea gigantea TaxID=171969 RepID=A0A9Q1GS08_9CARY|nr:hypothetical protein Cgig2_033994 [Carnegiea gigantea]
MKNEGLMGKTEEKKKKSSKENGAKKTSSKDGKSKKSHEKPQQDEQTFKKSLTKPENKHRGEKSEERKKEKPKKKAFLKGHISEVKISNDSDEEENYPTYEEEYVNGGDNPREKEEKTMISNIIKAVSKSNKLAFITGMSMLSFSLMVTLLKEAQIKAVRLMGFASFLKADLKQILRKFSKWLVESFGPYTISFRLLD